MATRWEFNDNPLPRGRIFKRGTMWVATASDYLSELGMRSLRTYAATAHDTPESAYAAALIESHRKRD